jgi:hypothetical protein
MGSHLPIHYFRDDQGLPGEKTIPPGSFYFKGKIQRANCFPENGSFHPGKMI